MKTITLNDGVTIPVIGFGTFRIPADGSTYRAVREAIDLGYRHVDTALMYGNEAEVGRAVRDSGIPRAELFVTSKLWISHYGYERAKVGLERSLRTLGLDYVDLYLLHQPYGDLVGAWRALEEGKAAGRIRSIGVSNMTVNLWNRYVSAFDTIPSVDQIECHPLAQQRAIRDFLAPKGVKVECWGPLAQGRTELLTDPTIGAIAEAHGRDVGQIILHFELQEGLIVLPKSVRAERIRSNLEVFDFDLTEEEMAAIRALDKNAVMRDPETPGVGEMLLAKYPLDD
ncbi:MAG: aldo/keto reductase [Clostridia bacterium]|nr:aldo/keto reductase [Clostridia bacterium]